MAYLRLSKVYKETPRITKLVPMQYREMGKTGLKVSALGFGAMRLPMEAGHVRIKEAVEVIRRAFDLGVNLIDTAVFYCNQESEITVGKALKGWRDRIILSTKNNYRENDPDEWRSVLDQSICRLDVDHIDIYNFHALNLEKFREWRKLPISPIDEMKKAKEDGLIKHIGFSCHDTPTNMIKLLDTGLFESMILQYNLLNTSNERIMAHAKRKGIGIIVMGPVGGGRLSTPSKALKDMMGKPVASTAELALRFVLSNPNVSAALSGMSTPEMVEENAATASIEEPLTPKERSQIMAALEEKKRLADLYCTGCGYCMPCPNGVDIPRNLELMNYYRLYGLREYARDQYKRLGQRMVEGEPKPAWAVACQECADCEGKCPQNIEIRKQLKEVDTTLSNMH
jgi:predicted aldo/keto reductase-like oxidoreductase